MKIKFNVNSQKFMNHLYNEGKINSGSSIMKNDFIILRNDKGDVTAAFVVCNGNIISMDVVGDNIMVGGDHTSKQKFGISETVIELEEKDKK